MKKQRIRNIEQLYMLKYCKGERAFLVLIDRAYNERPLHSGSHFSLTGSLTGSLFFKIVGYIILLLLNNMFPLVQNTLGSSLVSLDLEFSKSSFEPAASLSLENFLEISDILRQKHWWMGPSSPL